MSTIFEDLGVTYREVDGVFYPNIAIGVDSEQIVTEKYGDIWLQYVEESRTDYFRHLWRMGLLRKRASEINEEAYELLNQIMEKYLATHIQEDRFSALENWKLREQAKQVAEEIVFAEVIYRVH